MVRCFSLLHHALSQELSQEVAVHNAESAMLSNCARRRSAAVWAMVALCLAFVVASLSVLAAPSTALAKSYDCPQVNITAQVQSDGSLHVVEQRMFSFDGSFSAVWWTFSDLPDNAKLRIDSMRMGIVDSDGNVAGGFSALGEVPFQPSWRASGGPSGSAWSYDRAEASVYAFFDLSDVRAVFELEYTLVNGAQVYDDIAEVYWKYIPEGWDVASENVTMTIELPVPSGATVAPGDNVRAWGHGPLDGNLAVGSDGSITYEVPRVRGGQFAEARVVFPVGWLTNIDPQVARENQGVTRLDTVLSEEAGWSDKANNQRAASLFTVVAAVVLFAAILAVALFLFVRYGREHKPDFTGDYWRDVPQKGLQPAVIGRLWRWNHESPDDFTATIMHLAHTGALRIDKGAYTDPKGRLVDDYFLTCNDAVARKSDDPIEIATLNFLFNVIAQGRQSLWLGSMRIWGEANPGRFSAEMARWQGVLTAEANKHEFFEAKSRTMQTAVFAAAGLVFAVAFFVALFMENFVPAIFAVPTTVALCVIGNYMPRRTELGNNIVARAKALRNWLRDFSSLDERPPTDVRVWGEFMVYAYLFGVADNAMRELQRAVPEAFATPAASAPGVASSYVPWYVWYSPGYGHNGSVMPSAVDLVSASVEGTISSVQAALSAASGSSSSSGGFGGGFSGGGGGGFGGGGGAR